MTWHDRLNGDALPWLLESDSVNPGLRYFALRDLLDRPDDDADLREAKAAIMTTGPVPIILDAQHPDGYWEKFGGGYAPKYRGTVWQIMFLAELGADPADARVKRGCEYLLNHALASNGAFACVSSKVKPTPGRTIYCLNGNLIDALRRLGYADDVRVWAALEWLAKIITGEGDEPRYKSAMPGFVCAANDDQPCGWGAVKAMRALASVPPGQGTPAIRRALDAGAEFLLSRDPAAADYPYRERVSSTWFKLGFPLSYWSDVLENAAVLAQLGYGNDPRLENVIRLILDKQDGQGRWKLENSLKSKMWVDIEKKGQASKWITLRARRLLKSLS